jgi:outer membrane protein assembly factor BamB
VVAAAALLAGGATAALSQGLPTEVRWQVALSSAAGTPPVLAAGVLAVSLRDGGVVAHRTPDGTRAWSIDLAPSQPLAADDERLYAITAGSVHALESATGTVAWTTPVPGVTLPPLVRAGWLILAGDAGVVALRASDGREMWRVEPGAVRGRPAIDGDLVYVPVAGARVVALEITTGAVRWQRVLGGEPGEPYGVGGRVYLGAEDRWFYALTARDGEVEWRARAGAAPRGRPAADEDRVYFVGFDNVLYAYDRGHGALRWRVGVPYRPTAGPVVLGETLIVPGPTADLISYGAQAGAAGPKIPLGARLATIPEFVRLDNDRLHMAVVTGDLNAAWTLTLLGPEIVPRLPVSPLKELPGAAVPLGPPGR